jgi:DNA repair protein RadB
MKTGCALFDEMTDGIPEKMVSQVYGEYATGKTTLCLQMCVRASRAKKKSFFIDTEGGFSPERLAQMGGEAALKDVMVFEVRDFSEQTERVIGLEGMMSGKVGFVCVDSVVSLYRLEASDYDARLDLSREMGRQLLVLSRIARTNNIPVLVTNQVYEKMPSDSNQKYISKGISREGVMPLGGDVLKYWCKMIVKLEKVERAVRRATLVRHSYKEEEVSCLVSITHEGIL